MDPKTKQTIADALVHAAAALEASAAKDSMLYIIRKSVHEAVSKEGAANKTRPLSVEAPVDLQDLINHTTPEERQQVTDTLAKENIEWPYSRSAKWAMKLLS